MYSKHDINFNTIVQRDNKQLFSKIDFEVVMLNIDNGEYYNLNEIGSIIWEAIKEPATIRLLVESLRKIYNVPEEICLSDTTDFIHLLIKKGVVKIVDEKV